MFSMFREAPTPESPKGQVSIRRVLAAFFSASSIALPIVGAANGVPWQGLAVLAGIPVLAVLVLLFFTTWGDIAGAVKTIKG